jgi:hypothetical protein
MVVAAFTGRLDKALEVRLFPPTAPIPIFRNLC